MIRISRNLKKFRKQANLTQKQLAEKMNITRQAISNWENDKSQPDIDSIVKLSEALGISVEEMIYGDLRKVGTDENTDNKINVIKIVLSVFGGLFVATGLIILFVAFWQDFPDTVKLVFSFFPLLIALVFAVYVMMKKGENRVLAEIAGIVWCACAIASAYLSGNVLYDILSLDAWYVTEPIIETLPLILIIAAFYCLRSVCILPVYYTLLTLWGVNVDLSVGSNDENLSVYLMFVFLMAVLPSVGIIMKENSEERYKFAVWVNAIGFIAVNLSMNFSASGGLILQNLTVLLISYCLLGGKDSVYSLPFRIIGTLGVCASSLISVALILDSTDVSFTKLGQIFVIFTAVGFLGLCIYRVQIDYRFSASSLLMYISSALIMLVGILWSIFRPEYNEYNYYEYITEVNSAEDKLRLVLVIVAALVGLSFVFTGIRSLMLFELNCGIVTVFAALVMFVTAFIELNMFSVGILLILFGGSMFAANILVSRQRKE